MKRPCPHAHTKVLYIREPRPAQTFRANARRCLDCEGLLELGRAGPGSTKKS